MREGEKSWPGDRTRTEYLPSYSRQLAIPHRPGPYLPSLWGGLLPSRAPRAAHREPTCGVWLGRPRANMPQLSHRQFLSLNSDPIRHFLSFVTILASRNYPLDKFSPLCSRFRGGKCFLLIYPFYCREKIIIGPTLASPGTAAFSGRTYCLPTTVVSTQVFFAVYLYVVTTIPPNFRWFKYVLAASFCA